jgi:hypothetical protein
MPLKYFPFILAAFHFVSINCEPLCATPLAFRRVYDVCKSFIISFEPAFRAGFFIVFQFLENIKSIFSAFFVSSPLPCLLSCVFPLPLMRNEERMKASKRERRKEETFYAFFLLFLFFGEEFFRFVSRED